MYRHRVFVGSTFEDLQQYRNAVKETLHALGFVVVGMEYFGSRPNAPLDACLAAVEESQAYIGIFATRYGSIDPGSGKSITHLEYEEARRLGLPSLIYILDEDRQPVNAKYVDTGDSAKALRDLKKELMQWNTIYRFTTPDDLARQIAIDVKWFRKRPVARVRRSDKNSAGWTLSIGAQPDPEGTRFRVWARDSDRVEVLICGDCIDGAEEAYELKPEGDGYFSDHIKNVEPGARYRYRLNGGESFPDPASRYQPDGVKGPSQVVDPKAFTWTDRAWKGKKLEDLVIYELHVGAATPEGTFDALIDRLGDIRAFGATAIQLMPVADFAGDRNWGYDGVDVFAPAGVYGGPSALRRLVDTAHRHELAVILDVVFNHFGPDGNYLAQFSRSYFREGPDNEWGKRIAYVGVGAWPVRNFIIENARYWAVEYHVDGLRLDAIQAIEDDDEPHIVTEIVKGVREVLPQNRSFVVIAEDEFNRPCLVQPFENQRVERRGYGLDAIYADDFHHQVHVALTGPSTGYYGDYSGSMDHLATTIEEGWWFTGQYSDWRKKKVGESARVVAPKHLVWCLQNHDQVGNRPFGERLNCLVEAEVYRAASALLLLSPYTPLLFMGQEWGAKTPFLFFTNHVDSIGRDVTQGRLDTLKRLFPDFDSDLVPEPQDEKTFSRSKLKWQERNKEPHAGFLELYTDLLKLRRKHEALRHRERDSFSASSIGQHALVLSRNGPSTKDALLVVANLRGHLTIDLGAEHIPPPPVGSAWVPLFDTEQKKYGGRGGVHLSDEGILEISAPSVVLLGPHYGEPANREVR